MRREPKHGPILHIPAAQAENTVNSASLGIVGVLGLLAVAAVRVDQLAAASKHQQADSFQSIVIEDLAEPVDVGRHQHAVGIDMLVLG